MGDVIKGIGKVAGVAAPFASLIPGVGPLAGAAIGAGGKLLSGGGLGGAAAGAAEGGLGGIANRALSAPGSSLLDQIGSKIKDTFAPGGNLDLAKVLGGVGGIANMVGAGQQRNNAQNYANAQIGQRNALMSKILGPQNYGLPAPNLNQQSSSTPGIGSGTTGGY